MLSVRVGALDVMDTVEHMRDLVLAAAFLAYRRTGSYQEAARLLGLPASRADVHGWLVRCVIPSDAVVFEMYGCARELLQGEIDTVNRRMDPFLQPDGAITFVERGTESHEDGHVETTGS